MQGLSARTPVARGPALSRSRRALVSLLLVLGLVIPGGTASAARAASASGRAAEPGPLWSAYRLDVSAGSRSAGYDPAQVPAPPKPDDLVSGEPSRPAPSGGGPARAAPGGGGTSLRLPAAAVVALALVVAARWLGVRRRRRPAAPAPALPAGPSREVEAPRDHVGPLPGAPVLAYISFGAADSKLGVPGLIEQEARIRERCENEGWRLVEVLSDDRCGLDPGNERPALAHAVERIGAGEARYLIVSQLDRLGGSALELGAALERLRDHDATLVSLDDAPDPSSHQGGKVTDALQTVAERKRIAAGTGTGHGVARAAGPPVSRPAMTDRPALRQRIAAMRAQGMTLEAIADALNQEGVPTVRGGALWRPSSVQGAAGYKRPRPEHGRPRFGESAHDEGGNTA